MSEATTDQPNDAKRLNDLITLRNTLQTEITDLTERIAEAGEEDVRSLKASKENKEVRLKEVNDEIQKLSSSIDVTINYFKIPQYYYLGSVLEAISFSLGYKKETEGVENKKRILNMVYTPLKQPNGEPITWSIAETINSDEDIAAINKSDSQKQEVVKKTIQINTVFEVPVSKEKVDSALS